MNLHQTLQAFLIAVIYTLMGWEEVDNEAAHHVMSAGRIGSLRKVCRIPLKFAGRFIHLIVYISLS